MSKMTCLSSTTLLCMLVRVCGVPHGRPGLHSLCTHIHVMIRGNMSIAACFCWACPPEVLCRCSAEPKLHLNPGQMHQCCKLILLKVGDNWTHTSSEFHSHACIVKRVSRMGASMALVRRRRSCRLQEHNGFTIRDVDSCGTGSGGPTQSQDRRWADDR